jgi:cytochrome c556
MRKIFISYIVATVATLSLANAAENPKVQYSKDVMNATGSHTNIIVNMLKGDINDSTLSNHASALANTAKSVKEAFKEDLTKLSTKTEAKPEIWSDWQGFSKASDEFEAASAEFAKKTKAGKVSMDDFAPVLKTCKSCHKAYKK